MKVYVEQKECTIDGKKYPYNAYHVELELGVLGKYNLNLPIESKAEKDLLSQFVDIADFDLVVSSYNNADYIKAVITIDLNGGKKITIPVKFKPDSLMLVRLAKTL